MYVYILIYIYIYVKINFAHFYFSFFVFLANYDTITNKSYYLFINFKGIMCDFFVIWIKYFSMILIML